MSTRPHMRSDTEQGVYAELCHILKPGWDVKTHTDHFTVTYPGGIDPTRWMMRSGASLVSCAIAHTSPWKCSSLEPS
jgi:hypothetical protein